MEDLSNEEDLALMARIARDDESAFQTLVEKHQHAVIGTIAKMTQNSADSEDLAQQVFLRIWKSAKRYKATAKFTTYLFTITRNLVFNDSRKKSRRKEHSLNEQTDDWQNSLADPNTSFQPDQALAETELRRIIDQAIVTLPEKQRISLILRRYEKMPYEEIARVLKISVPAVKSQLFRARAHLRESLAPHLKIEH